MNRVSRLEVANDEFKQKIESLEIENVYLKVKVKKLENEVFMGATPASCQQLADEGISENGDYFIQPSTDYEPFNVF